MTLWEKQRPSHQPHTRSSWFAHAFDPVTLNFNAVRLRKAIFSLHEDSLLSLNRAKRRSQEEYGQPRPHAPGTKICDGQTRLFVSPSIHVNKILVLPIRHVLKSSVFCSAGNPLHEIIRIAVVLYCQQGRVNNLPHFAQSHTLLLMLHVHIFEEEDLDPRRHTQLEHEPRDAHALVCDLRCPFRR